MGFVLILFGFIYFLKERRTEKTAKFGLWSMLLGGYGFVVMFYLAGALGVPRRFANYIAIPIPRLVKIGQETALIASIFFVVFTVGMLLYYIAVFGKSKQAKINVAT